MGTWGSSLYANDTTSDVRDSYTQMLKDQLSNQEAYEKILKNFKDCMEDEDEAPLFWYALAETQWKTGRLLPEVKAKALEWIDKEGGAELWEENTKGAASWKKTLEALRVKLESEQRKEKKFRKKVIPNQNPWNLYDVYAYRVHAQSWREKEETKKDESEIFGKYILFQKIGENSSWHNPLDTVMMVQIFERAFDNIPSPEDVHETMHNYRLLPLSYPKDLLNRYRRRALGLPDPSNASQKLCIYNPVAMSVRMEQYDWNPSYPKDELTFICNVEYFGNRQHERKDGEAFSTLEWEKIRTLIGWYFALWKNLEYTIVGDGTFEYPTLEQQQLMRDEAATRPNTSGTKSTAP